MSRCGTKEVFIGGPVFYTIQPFVVCCSHQHVDFELCRLLDGIKGNGDKGKCKKEKKNSKSNNQAVGGLISAVHIRSMELYGCKTCKCQHVFPFLTISFTHLSVAYSS